MTRTRPLGAGRGKTLQAGRKTTRRGSQGGEKKNTLNPRPGENQPWLLVTLVESGGGLRRARPSDYGFILDLRRGSEGSSIKGSRLTTNAHARRERRVSKGGGLLRRKKKNTAGRRLLNRRWGLSRDANKEWERTRRRRSRGKNKADADVEKVSAPHGSKKLSSINKKHC